MELIGRAHELEQLRQALAEALAGGGRVVLLAGEPGIGKTRLVDELASEARARGLPVVWGRTWEAGGAPAYWPWSAALESLVGDLGESELASLRAALGPGAAALGALLPELAARLGGISATPPSAEEARFRLFRAVSALVRRLASPAGLVVVLEDLHAADEASLLLLHFVAREVRGMRLLLLGTYRDAEASAEPTVGELLTRVGREGTTLALSPLSREAARALLAQKAAGLSPELVEHICDRTQGNPLFLEELARAQASGEPAATAAVPASIRGVIRQRLDRVSPEARGFLELAAVAGDELDIGQLALASGLPRPVVQERFEEARRAGLVKERASSLRFGHALVREVLYQDLSPAQRRLHHGAVARALEDPRRDRTKPAAAAERAHHLLAGPVENMTRAVDTAIAAADEALAALAYEEAVAGLARAAAALEEAGQMAAEPAETADAGLLRARLTLAQGRAHIRSGDGRRGKVHCREAARLAREHGATALLAEAALSYGKVMSFGIVDPLLIDLLEEALASLPEEAGPAPLRNRLRARLAAALQPAARTGEPVKIAREAIAGARQVSDRRHLLETINAGMAAMMDVAPPRERLALNLEAEQLALALDDQESRLHTLGRLAVDHMGFGDFAGADARIAAFEALARELRAPWLAWRGPLFRSMRAMLQGHFAEAEALEAEAARLGLEARDPQSERCVAMHRESLLRVAERHQEMLAHDLVCRRHRANIFGGQAWEATASVAWQSTAAALIASRLEDREKTQLHLGLVPPQPFPPIDNLFAMFHCAEPVAFAGTAEQAEVLHGLVSALADEDVMLGMTQLSWEGPATRLLALLEARVGRLTEAEAHFDSALARCQRLGAHPLAARTRYEWGRAVLARDQPRALGLIGAAHAEAQALGLTGLVALAAARLPPAVVIGASGVREGAAVPAREEAAQASVTFSNEGEVWAIVHGGATFRLKDSLGLRYLARLLEAPEREVHVLELAGGAGAEGEGGTEAVDGGDAGELLDEEARHSYKDRLEDLREQLDEATSFGDPTRAAVLREELTFLTAELSRAVGLGGRARRAGSAAERARSAVQRRIKNALHRIAEQDPALAAYLGRAVKTGNFCVFRPVR